jgi:hypothetical protein
MLHTATATARLRADEEGTAPQSVINIVENISRDSGRPHLLNVHSVRLIIRELRRWRRFLALLMRPPQTLFQCAACEPEMAVMCLDGNFKLYRYDRHFASWSEPVVGLPGAPGSFFANPATVEAGLDWVEQKRKERKGSTDVARTCGAAEIDALKGKTHAGGHLMRMANSGMYVAACPHSVLYRGFDFSGGERFALSIVMYMLLGVKPHMICGDTMCRVQSLFDMLQKSATVPWVPPLPDGLMWHDTTHIAFCVNALHVMGVRTFPARFSASPRMHSMRAYAARAQIGLLSWPAGRCQLSRVHVWLCITPDHVHVPTPLFHSTAINVAFGIPFATMRVLVYTTGNTLNRYA